MMNWLTPALIAFVLWGVWAFLPKIATQYINPSSVIVFEVIGTLIVGLIALLSMDFKLQTQPQGILLAIIIGALGLGGSFAYVYAVSKGQVGIVSIVTALYPLLTILLAYFVLHEPITIKQGIGIGMALVAIFLLST